MVPQRLVNAKFQEIKALETSPPPRVRVTRPQWMSAESICLISAHADLRHFPDHNRNQALTLMQAILSSLSTDSLCSLEDAVEDTCAFL